MKKTQPFITTIQDRCRVCYTCVRECPAKAIRIADGQAMVVAERCIGCGNCVRVCSQKAKKVRSSIPAVNALLGSDDTVIAAIAPSFPVDFTDISPEIFVGMVRSLGFDHVVEVGFGADLVAWHLRKLLASDPDRRWISTACPAVFGFVKRYHPELLDSLSPIVSPMVATARVMRKLHGKDIKIVFIGPCISKKIEAASEEIEGEIEEVLTFTELHLMFKETGTEPAHVKPAPFDPPLSGKGSLFPIGRGLLEAADIREDLISGDVISANGRETFIDAVTEFNGGEVSARFLDVLCCDGCIMGSGLSTEDPMFKRRNRVSNYVRDVVMKRDETVWQEAIEQFSNVDLAREYLPNDQRIPTPAENEILRILSRMGKQSPVDELNCGACGYDTCRAHAIAIHKGLAESEMCLPYSIEKLRKTISELNESNMQLADVREALIQSEKMASMGQLAAGIAHEVNNPLGVVLMYAHILLEEAETGNPMAEDMKMIAEHADRAKKIVSGLLHFARQNKVDLKHVNLREFIHRTLQSMQIPENVSLQVLHNLCSQVIDMDPDQMAQVMTNLLNNAVTAMPNGGVLTVTTQENDSHVSICVTDTGTGIEKSHLSKIFEPFFTTKEIGKGTGLGLAVTYGIVKMHRGDITVESNTDASTGPTGTTFKITLPKAKSEETA